MPTWLTLPEMPLYVLVAMPFIVLAAYTIFGATGFGSSIVAVPLYAHWFPLAFAVPLVTTMDVYAASSSVLRQRAHVAWPVFLRLLPAMLIGMAIGGTLLLKLSRTPAVFALGIFVTLYGSYVLSGARGLRQAPAWLVWPIGLVGGVFSALFGTGGPVYIVFLSARIHDKFALRATSALVVSVSVWIRFAMFVATGLLLDTSLLVLGVCLLPVMIMGLKLGNRLHQALSGAGVLRLIAGLLVVNGVSLVFRALREWDVV